MFARFIVTIGSGFLTHFSSAVWLDNDSCLKRSKVFPDLAPLCPATETLLAFSRLGRSCAEAFTFTLSMICAWCKSSNTVDSSEELSGLESSGAFSVCNFLFSGPRTPTLLRFLNSAENYYQENMSKYWAEMQKKHSEFHKKIILKNRDLVKFNSVTLFCYTKIQTSNISKSQNTQQWIQVRPKTYVTVWNCDLRLSENEGILFWILRLHFCSWHEVLQFSGVGLHLGQTLQKISSLQRKPKKISHFQVNTVKPG